MPKFSVIIPTYNRRSFLETAIDSVLRQSYRDFELIVIDDGSEDNTSELLENYDDNRLKIIYQEHQGVSIARNTALRAAIGEYIAFLDSDDRWLSKKLEICSKAISDNPDQKVFHTQEKWFRNGKHLNHLKKHMKKGGYIFKDCLKLCSVSISTAVIDKNIFIDLGNFREDMEVCEDYEFWLRVSSKYPIYLIDRVLTEKEGGHSDQLSLKYWGMDRFRIKAIADLIDSNTISQDMYISALQELEKKCQIYIMGCMKRNKIPEADIYRDILYKYIKRSC